MLPFVHIGGDQILIVVEGVSKDGPLDGPSLVLDIDSKVGGSWQRCPSGEWRLMVQALVG